MPDMTESRAPRRRPSRSRRLLAGLAVLGGCLVAGWALHVAAQPYVKAYRMRAENAQIERQILAMRQELQGLRKSVAALGTPQGMEREARRLGYLRPGEIPLIIPNP